jgi:hypothetical protein
MGHLEASQGMLFVSQVSSGWWETHTRVPGKYRQEARSLGGRFRYIHRRYCRP